MIPESYIKSLGLTDEQSKAVSTMLNKEQRFYNLLLQAGIMPKPALKVLNSTDITKVDFEKEDELSIHIKNEWGDFITRPQKGN